MTPVRSHAKLNINLLHSMKYDRCMGPEQRMSAALSPLNVGVMRRHRNCQKFPTVYYHVVEVEVSTGELAIQAPVIQRQELNVVSLWLQEMSFFTLHKEWQHLRVESMSECIQKCMRDANHRVCIDGLHR
jgi:hypothetical protein